MDAQLIMDILKMVGLPGLVVVGWIISNMTGVGSPDKLIMWGLALLSSIIVNFATMRNKSLVSDINHMVSSTMNSSIKPLVETIRNIIEIDDKLLDEVTAMKEIYEGGLTTKQLKFLLPRVFDAFKWRILRICINVAAPKGHTVFDRRSVEDTVITQFCSSLSALAEYNQLLKQPTLSELVCKAVSNIFDVLYGRDFIDIEDHKQRVSTLLEIVMTELDLCCQSVMTALSATEVPQFDAQASGTTVLETRSRQNDE